ncbi:TatD DNase [Entomophthora muscae]|uniref:TatD DNase n=2 Tax=Entomophthora muscae TaxID=34485 RepID=A0ACC2S0S1_9FUNG|nr:TatD DNase [Entomophthora muscae]
MSEVKEYVDNSIKLADIRVNLCDKQFEGVYEGKRFHHADVDQVLKRAKELGVDKIIAHSMDIRELQTTQELAARYKDSGIEITFSLGVHPYGDRSFFKDHDPDDYIYMLREVLNLNRGKFVALGDCGLDYSSSSVPMESQLIYLKKQVLLAKEYDLPILFYEPGNNRGLIDFLKRNQIHLQKGVITSFTGTLEEACDYLSLDLYIGLDAYSFKTEENISVIRDLPLDRIVIGTESPYHEIRPDLRGYRYLLKSLVKYEGIHPTNSFIIKRRERFVQGCMVKSRNEPCCLL